MQDYMPQWPLKILILSSNPRNADRLRLAQEHRDLQIAIRGTRFASSLRVFNESSCRYSDITAALDRVDPHILHFSGHGGEDVLYFEDDQGLAKAVNKQALARLLSHQKELQLVILNACFSLDQGQAFADAVGLVIVSEGSILDRDAIDFSRELYTALGYGQRSYIGAFERAKAALEMTGQMRVHLLQRGTPGVQDVPVYEYSSLPFVRPQQSIDVRPHRTLHPRLRYDREAVIEFISHEDDDDESYATWEAESLARAQKNKPMSEQEAVRLQSRISMQQDYYSRRGFNWLSPRRFLAAAFK